MKSKLALNPIFVLYVRVFSTMSPNVFVRVYTSWHLPLEHNVTNLVSRTLILPLNGGKTD